MNTLLSDALGLVSESLNNLLSQLKGEKNEQWLEILKLMSRMSPEKILKALREAEVWKKIQVGGRSVKDEFLEKFKMANCGDTDKEKVGIHTIYAAYAIVCASPYEEAEESVEFVMWNLADLGLKKKVWTEDLLNEAFLASLGLDFCKPSDAYYLRLNYTDQPSEETVFVGMKPVDFHGLQVLVLKHGSVGISLVTNQATPRVLWPIDSLWIFRQRKS